MFGKEQGACQWKILNKIPTVPASIKPSIHLSSSNWPRTSAKLVATEAKLFDTSARNAFRSDLVTSSLFMASARPVAWASAWSLGMPAASSRLTYS